MNKQINELRTKIDNIKEETSQDMEYGGKWGVGSGGRNDPSLVCTY
jgi:hypothetical protein